MKLSIIIPVYNEATKINSCLESLEKASLQQLNLDKEIIMVDDGSTDGTKEALESLKDKNYIIIHNSINLGKGTAISKFINNLTY